MAWGGVEAQAETPGTSRPAGAMSTSNDVEDRDEGAAASDLGLIAGMDQIGEYLVRRLVGEGGMGRVYEAEERLSKRRVALKVLRDELSKSERARSLFLTEMQILAYLEHPNIVRSLASIEDDGKLVMVLEFLEGRTLRDTLNERGRLSWEQAATVTMAVARALGAAHGQSPPVIHRDLKPENIMLLEDGSVKVMDFGIAKLLQELNQTNTQSVGTLQYMSPEQIDAEPVDARTDLYCLGLVFYELLTGHPPFQSSSPRALLNQQCGDPPPPLDDVRCPKGLTRVLFRLLEKRPGDRPQSAAEVVEDLEDYLPDAVDMGAPARPETSPSSDESLAKRREDTMPSAGNPKSPASAAKTSSAAENRKATPREPAPRKDTVALIEEASGARELPLKWSVLIIVVFMAASAAATYAWRSSQTSPTPDDAASSD